MTRTPASAPDAPPAPCDFVWGVSTSSYQIEGATREDGRGPSIWDTWCTQAARIANADTGDVACDHYHRSRNDVALMRELGVTAYRFSVAWPRALPQGRGAVNEAGLAFHDPLIDALLDAGIAPWPCLYHWDLPQALDDLGGRTNRDSAGWFADHATLIARRFGDQVKHFATCNEASVFSLLGYCIGGPAPGIASRAMLLRTIHHVNLAHGAAIDALRAHLRNASLGIVHNVQRCLQSSDTPENVAAAKKFDAYWNNAYPDPQLVGHYPPLIADAIAPDLQAGDLARICRPLDWFGVNHYSPLYLQASDNPLGAGFGPMPPEVPRTANDWPMAPHAFRDTLLKVHEWYRLPIDVTEDGTANADVLDQHGKVVDQPRIDFLKAYTDAMFEAIRAGADVRGYFVWSPLDNFEWGAGYTQRFGLTDVDYPTQRRIPKASFYRYAGLIKASGRVPAGGERRVAQKSPQ